MTGWLPAKSGGGPPHSWTLSREPTSDGGRKASGNVSSLTPPSFGTERHGLKFTPSTKAGSSATFFTMSITAVIDQGMIKVPGEVPWPSGTVVRIEPVEQPRPSGLAKGQFTVPEDFNAPLPEDVLRTFEGK